MTHSADTSYDVASVPAGVADGADGADGRHDFDFLVGTWNVHHRKLADTTDPSCDEWLEFDGVQWMRQTLGGLGNVDNVRVERLPTGRTFEGMAVRLFDPEARTWRIYWASTALPGQLDPGVSGHFNGPHGEFFGEDIVAGRAVLVRFDWDVHDPEVPQWEQAFSFDDGETWIHNWRMSFTRISREA